MKRFIVTGHGRFAEGMKSAVELIMGRQEFIDYINFESNDTPAILRASFEKVMSEHCDDEFAFFTDLIGGTPFKESVMCKTECDRIEVFTGTNLPMLIQAIQMADEDNNVFDSSVLKVAQESCFKYKYVKYEEQNSQEGI